MFCELTDFGLLSKMQAELKGTTKTSEKEAILLSYKGRFSPDFLKKACEFLWGETKFKVASARVLERIGAVGCFEALPLDDRELIDHLERIPSGNGNNSVLELCVRIYGSIRACDEGIAQLFLDILDKDFRCGVNRKLIEKVYPEFMPKGFAVALANKYADCKDKVDFEKDVWYGSRKCDGVRCIAIKRNGSVKFYTRQGKEILTLAILNPVIESTCIDNVAFDGELCIVDGDGNEDFQSIMKEVTRKNHIIQHPFYQMFDCILLDEFENRAGTELLETRLARLNDVYSKLSEPAKRYCKPLYQTKVLDETELRIRFSQAVDLGWEGLMIRKNVPYEGKRTNNLLKVKGFNDAEYVIVDYAFGDMRFAEDGIRKVEHCLANITIEHKGCRVQVGSGLTRAERRYWTEHCSELIGKTVTVKYFAESQNQDGGYSLRFPTIKCIYDGNKREV